MGHYAKVINGKVSKVIVADSDFFEKFVDDSPGMWIQTSYNTRGGIHYGPDNLPDKGIAIRGNYAGTGYIYDAENDVFYAPKPFPSWTICAPSWIWEAPVARPNDDKDYWWNELILEWILCE